MKYDQLTEGKGSRSRTPGRSTDRYSQSINSSKI